MNTYTELVNKLQLDRIDAVEIMNEMRDEHDFELFDYRFIHSDYIEGILEEDLESDAYMLGCFSAWFIADYAVIDIEIVETLQEAEAFEALGRLIISKGRAEDMAEGYASTDGFGHHFSSYDGNEIEIGDWHIFRVN